MEEVFVILASCFGAATIITAPILAIGYLMRGRKGSKGDTAEESRLIQEIHRKLNKLEDRIESLETILTESERLRSKI